MDQCSVLGADQGLCGWSRERIRACGRSWAALGASMGGLGPVSGPMWAVLAAIGAYVGGLGRGSGRKVAQTRAGAGSGQGSGPHRPA